jgi:hypothetical protein
LARALDSCSWTGSEALIEWLRMRPDCSQTGGGTAIGAGEHLRRTYAGALRLGSVCCVGSDHREAQEDASAHALALEPVWRDFAKPLPFVPPGSTSSGYLPA